MIIGIVAIAKNYAIGKDGKLPWHYSADLKFFKETTSGNTVVMGRKTYESIGKPLPKRLNIVLSGSDSLKNQTNIFVLQTKEEILNLAGYLRGDIFIIGGAKTYAEFADVIEKWIVTEVPEIIDDADAFMPKDFLKNFAVIETKFLEDRLEVKFYEKMSRM